MSADAITFGSCGCRRRSNPDDPTDPTKDIYWGGPVKAALGYVGWHMKFPFGSHGYIRPAPAPSPEWEGRAFEHFQGKIPDPITKGLIEVESPKSSLDGFIVDGGVIGDRFYTLKPVTHPWDYATRYSPPLLYPANAVFIEWTPNQVLANFEVVFSLWNYGKLSLDLRYKDQSDIVFYNDGSGYRAPTLPWRRYTAAFLLPGMAPGSYKVGIGIGFPRGAGYPSIQPGFEMKIRATFIFDPRARPFRANDPDYPTGTIPW